MAITFQAENVALPNIKKRATSNWIKVVAEAYGKKAGDVSYIFCDDAKILEINQTYLHHDFYTDIITFDYSEGDRISGDIFISIDTVRSNAEKYGTNFDDELHRVIIHGILHLCGLKDKSEADSKKMREAEDKALSIKSK
ncbi:MAG TPA: rRNA maturation RNase YbeY [Dysgonamonadaceae bacterium]|nr:rRNA maturation RNase YbeY [Dysgonamonadaceae bacterium]HOM63682.1 rRNA maturation RNase YbeY [Dysgonamonadaceae bacterium]HPD43164.1 rRNA maturation RNase YbeY [Dysgonamonadaceae bacterium]HRS40792.1 rRNA maturation RNase YbeY [Dysgonamonadaceae bacterium]